MKIKNKEYPNILSYKFLKTISIKLKINQKSKDDITVGKILNNIFNNFLFCNSSTNKKILKEDILIHKKPAKIIQPT